MMMKSFIKNINLIVKNDKNFTNSNTREANTFKEFKNQNK